MEESELLSKSSELDKQIAILQKSKAVLKKQVADIETEIMGLVLQKDQINESLKYLKFNK